MCHKKRFAPFVLLTFFLVIGFSCTKTTGNVIAQPIPTDIKNDVTVWITKPDQSLKLGRQLFSSNSGNTSLTLKILFSDAEYK